MDFIEQLKSSVDIVKVAGEYVRLKRAGGGPRWVGLCPFHTEKTPSFSVHQTHQFYKCFGCGAGGDVIRFIMEIERLSFFEAVKLLAERHGIPMPERREAPDAESRLRSAVLRMHEIAGRTFREALEAPAGAGARQYLARRGISLTIAAEFGLGFAERSGQELFRRLQREGFEEQQLEASGLVLRRQDGGGFYDRFRNRLMFPIHSESGKIIAFAGRALSAEDEPKYLNSPETPVYTKSRVVYNLHRAKDEIRKCGYSVLVEGYMDVIGLHAAGIRPVVASCGTALTNWQVRSLRRHASEVIVNFDPDEAGGNATERSIQLLLEESAQVRVLELEGGLDPDEYVKKSGVDVYRQKLERAPGYFIWLADRAQRRFDVRTAQGQVAALQFLLPAIQRVHDKLERAAIANEVAGRLGVTPGLVLDHFQRAATERKAVAMRPPAQPVRPVEKLLLNAALLSPEVRDEVLPQLESMPEFGQFLTRRIFEKLALLHKTQREFTFADLDARLEEADRALAASLVFADELDEDAYNIEQARACLAAIERERREQQRKALRQRVKEAERTGDYEAVLRLTGELARLNREQAG
ncbi:MAG: DNA primase [Bryobacteraceae bacterium]